MSRSHRTAPLLLAACALVAGLALRVTDAAAMPVRTAHVEAELVAQKTALVPGASNVVALRLKLADGWHTYWRNAGDSGLSTTLDWKLPTGITAGPIEWLPPRLLPVGPLVNYGYVGEVLHPVSLSVAPGTRLGDSVTLNARADWLVCRETCIPEGADLSLTLPVAARADDDPIWGAPIASALAHLPQPLTGWSASAEGQGQTIKLMLRASGGGVPELGNLRFFPNDDGRIEPSGSQPQSRIDNGYALNLPVAYQLARNVTRLTGLLEVSNGIDGAQAFTLDVPLTGSIVAGPKPADTPVGSAPALAPARAGSGTAMTVGLALLFALVGGVLLNLMPCVFPVLSIKVLGFAQRKEDERAAMRIEAAAFAGGTVLTFVALAALLLVLRAAGAQLGWGFQLQSPAVVTGLALLFFVLGLNLAGMFEFGQLVPDAVGSWQSSNRTLDAFGAGVLAVIVASPCTAPFMGAALGFALGAPALVTLAIFAALGVGMALPYALLALFPAWRRTLPKPGAWMLRFKQLLAFPMFATVAWLCWVLGAQLDNDAVLRLLVVLLCAAFALWAWQAARVSRGRAFGWAALCGLALTLFVAAPLASLDAHADAHRTATTEGQWAPFSASKVNELYAGGRAVFVDFTAAWCVTCQVNKRTTLNRPAVTEAFTAHNVALLRADWTRQDPGITRALAALGRDGVPAYVLYRPGKEPLLLPEILTPQVVLDALATLAP
jgi:thiol:disulfide interchange protein DsbD